MTEALKSESSSPYSAQNRETPTHDPSMITIDRINLSYGERKLFREVSAVVGPHDRIGLVGSNGTGKTTLLKMLLGEEGPDSGGIDRAGYISIGYLPQEGIRTEGHTLFEEAESAFSDILDLRRKVEQGTTRLEELNHEDAEYGETLELLGDWEQRLEEMEASKLKSRVEAVLFGLGFRQDDLGRDTREFSGGWQMRIALAKLLLQEPDLLLLDEPTNHLDLPSLRWLERFLTNYRGSIILVSHDRSFLDFLTRQTFSLSRGRLEVYAGNYSFFERESADRKERLVKAQKSQQRKLAQTERFIERFRYKNTKARQVQSRIKALQRIDRIEIESEEEEIAFSFPPPRRSGRTVMTLEEISKSFGSQSVFLDFNFEIERGDRLAIVGMNGAGKSTLSRILAGVEPIDQGERIVGHNVDIAYFGQDQTDALNPELSALETLEKVESDGRRENLRTILGGFLFQGDDANKKVSVLSGGERNRLALAKMLLTSANFLILDEPTNHLDMRSKSVLQKALKQYPGTFAIISHDRSFLGPLTNKVLEITIAGWRLFPGNFSEYLVDLDEREKRDAETLKGRSSPRKDPLRGRSAKAKERRRRGAQRRQKVSLIKKELKDLETRIATLESEIKSMETAMLDPGFFKNGDETRKDLEQYETLKRRLTRTYEKWEEVTEVLLRSGDTA